MSKHSEYIPRPDAKLVKKELIAESKRAAKETAKAEAIDFLRENLPNEFEETAKAWRETDKRILERGPLLGKVGMTLTVTCVFRSPWPYFVALREAKSPHPPRISRCFVD